MRILKTMVVALTACGWVGVLISGLFSYAASEDEAAATVEENTANRKDADKLNAIRLAQYEREQRFKEGQERYNQRKDKIKQFENMVNSSAALKDRLTSIWGKGAYNAN